MSDTCVQLAPPTHKSCPLPPSFAPHCLVITLVVLMPFPSFSLFFSSFNRGRREMFLQGYYLFMYHYCLFLMIFTQLSALRVKHFWCSGCLFGPSPLILLFFPIISFPFFTSPSAIVAERTIEYSRTFSRTKLAWNSTSRPVPLSSWLKWGETKPLLIIRHWCSVWKGFGGGFMRLPDSQPPRRWLRFYIWAIFQAVRKF